VPYLLGACVCIVSGWCAATCVRVQKRLGPCITTCPTRVGTRFADHRCTVLVSGQGVTQLRGACAQRCGDACVLVLPGEPCLRGILFCAVLPIACSPDVRVACALQRCARWFRGR